MAFCQTQGAGAAPAAEAKPDFRLTVHMTTDSGVQPFVPDKWGTLQLSLMNGRLDPREVVCSTYFRNDTSVQYGRRIWMPPRSLLRMSHPVLMPRHSRDEGRNIDLHSLVFDGSATGDVLIRSEGGVLRHDGALIVTHDARNTAVIAKLASGPDPVQEAIAGLVSSCRVELGLGNHFSWLGDAFLPPDEPSLDALDQIVVTDNRIVDDSAALHALRRWLHAGGRLWVMLDRVDAAVLEGVLGDEFAGYVVDRVSLTSVRVDEVVAGGDGGISTGETIEYDDPVDLVRMSVANVDVTHRVNGWPAAMTVPYGDGRLLITTLGARGWMKKLPDGAPRSSDPTKIADYKPTPPMANIADSFFRLREPPLLPPEALEPQVQEYIGYSVLPWSWIVGTLLGFSACFVAIGIVLVRFDRLEHICWIGSIPALAASLFLIQAGRANRRAVPATIASVQFLQALRGMDDWRSEGLIFTYQPEGSEFPIGATRGGEMKPDTTGLEQTSRRMVMTDLGVYHWDNLRQPAGVRQTSFTHSESAADRIAAYATLDSQGVVGRYRGSLPPGTDAILATRDGRMGVTLGSDGKFAGREEGVFEQDQYLSAGLLSDEQNRRRRTLKALLANPQRPDYPVHPQLMFWSDPRDNGFRFGEGLKDEGATLVAVPLVFERPASGAEILIPAPLVSYVNRRSPDGTRPSAMWNEQKKQWQERSSPGLAWLSFQIPRGLLPMTAARARIDLKVTGPIGLVEILGLRGGEVVSLGSVMNPVGSVSFDISDAEALAIDDDGRLALAVNAGQSRPAEGAGASAEQSPAGTPQPAAPAAAAGAKANYWRIEALTMQLWATTTELVSKD